MYESSLCVVYVWERIYWVPGQRNLLSVVRVRVPTVWYDIGARARARCLVYKLQASSIYGPFYTYTCVRVVYHSRQAAFASNCVHSPMCILLYTMFINNIYTHVAMYCDSDNTKDTCNQGIDAQIPTQYILKNALHHSHTSPNLVRFFSHYRSTHSILVLFMCCWYFFLSSPVLSFTLCLSIRLFTCCCCVHIYIGAKPKLKLCVCFSLNVVVAVGPSKREQPKPKNKKQNTKRREESKTFSFYCRARLSSIYVRFCDCRSRVHEIFNVIEARFETFKWIFISIYLSLSLVLELVHCLCHQTELFRLMLFVQFI